MGSPAADPPLFRQRNFSALWWGQLVSLVGERVTYLALIALLVAHTHAFRDARSSWLLSALANVMLAPVLLFAPFAGAWVDRRNLRRVMVSADLLRAGIIVLVPVLYLLTRSVTPVFVLLFLLFTCGVFFLPAKSAFTPEIVPFVVVTEGVARIGKTMQHVLPMPFARLEARRGALLDGRASAADCQRELDALA